MSITVNPTTVDRVIAVANVPSTSYRTCQLRITDAASGAGGGAGAAVATNVVFSTPLPTSTYTVHATPNQDAVPYITNKTTTGFTYTLNPRLAANTLSAGTNDITITWNV